jgi:excisionase family DNA binding protein
MYTAKEIAAILNLSVATVYQRIPGMRIGDARRYSRATVLDVIQNGVAMEPRPEAPQRVQYERRGRVKHLPRVVAKRPEKIESPTLTIKEAGKLLHLSPSKVRQLLEQRRIYHVREYGKTTIPRDALQFFIDGQSPRDFVEKLITYARNNPSWQKDINLLEEAAAKMRAEWSE